MKPFAIAFLLLSCAAFAQKDIGPITGMVVRVFNGADGAFAVCTDEGGRTKIHLFSGGLDKSATWELPADGELLPNERFTGHLAYAAMGPRDSAGNVLKIDLRFLSLGMGLAVPVRLAVKQDMPGCWLSGGTAYLINGKLCRLKGSGADVQRVSGAPQSVVSEDLSWCASAVTREEKPGYGVSIEVEQFATSDMISVENYTLKELDGRPLLAFSDDGRFLYYRSQDSPALYDLKERRSLSVDNINYKNPSYFGWFMPDGDYFVFHDFYSIAIVDVGHFEVLDAAANPFAEERMEILSVAKNEVRGALYQGTRQVKFYTKFFILNLKSGEDKVFTVPPRTIRVGLKKKTASFAYIDHDMLKYNQMELK